MPVPEIDVAELERRLAAGGTLIDVREPDEYRAGHVAGARPIPLADVPSRIDEVQGSGEILVICHLGGRSMKAAEFLTANGVTAVNVAGGTQAWIESGRPVESGDGG